VDRVTFGDASQAAARNFARFARSARKWNDVHGLYRQRRARQDVM